MTKTVIGIYARKTPVFCLSCTSPHTFAFLRHDEIFDRGEVFSKTASELLAKRFCVIDIF